MKKKNIIISIACSIFFIICVGATIILFPKVKEETIAYEYSNAIVHAFQGFRAPFSGKIVHIFPEQSAAFN